MLKINKKLTAVCLAIVMTLIGCTPTPSAINTDEPTEPGTTEPVSELPTETPAANSEPQRRLVGYFTSWGDTGLKTGYTVDDIPWGKITHINYAFAGVGEDNKIYLLDEAMSIKAVFDNLDPDLPYKGHFNLLQVYKRDYPDTKLLISVGGWGESGGFFPMTDTQQGIDDFAESCVQFLRDYDFDGIDIDFEFPTAVSGAGNYIDAAVAEPRRDVIYPNFCDLMNTLREKLDQAGVQDGKDYLLTMAAPASAWVLSGMGLGEYAQTLDYVNIMAYDLHGTWNSTVGPHAALLPDSRDPDTKGMAEPTLNADWSARYFAGILPADKIVVGMPYYCTGWNNVTVGSEPGGLWGRSNTAYNGASRLWQAMNLLHDDSNDFTMYFDEITQTPWLWSETQQVFLTIENEQSMAARAQYVIENGLGGLMMWELSGDYQEKPGGGYASGDTLTTVAHELFQSAAPLTLPDLPAAAQNGLTAEFAAAMSYPNAQYTFTITNESGGDIAGGFTLTLTLAGSAELQTAGGAVIESKEVDGLLKHYTLTVENALPDGGQLVLTGNINLPFTGGFRDVAVNGQSVAVQ